MQNNERSWHLSPDGEYFNLYDNYESREEAIAAGVQMYREVSTGEKTFNDLYQDELAWSSNPTFYVGRRMDWWPSIDEDGVIDQAQLQAYEYAGEFSDGWLEELEADERVKLRKMLRGTFDDWMKETGNEPDFFMVEDFAMIDPRDYTILDKAD